MPRRVGSVSGRSNRTDSKQTEANRVIKDAQQRKGYTMNLMKRIVIGIEGGGVAAGAEEGEAE